jgi:hypothetical protein
MRGRIGFIVFVAAVVGLAVYMLSVGWSQASLIAEVAGFFVAVAGLALALAARHSTPSEKPGRSKQQMRNVVSGANVLQEAHVSSGESVAQDMKEIRSRRSVRQSIGSFSRPHDRRTQRESDRNG